MGDQRKLERKKQVSPKDKEEKVELHEEINFCMMNVNSMHSESKEKLVRLGIADSQAEVIVLTETKLGEGSNKFRATGYKIIAQKDQNRGAGGIMILAKTNLKIREADAVDIVEEIQVAHFKFQDLLVIGLYRSPTILTTSSKEHHGKLIEYFNKKISEHDGSPYVVTGDFNLGELAKWDFNPPNLKPVEEGEEPSVAQMWSEWYNQNDLEQYVDIPTFVRSENRLDLAFKPKNQDVKNLKVTGSVFGPYFDHLTLLFGLQLVFETTESPRTRRNHTQEL